MMRAVTISYRLSAIIGEIEASPPGPLSGGEGEKRLRKG